MINYFKAAERLLAQRGNLEQALENLGRRRELASTQAKAERDNIKPRPYASSGGINAHTSARLELAEINREIVSHPEHNSGDRPRPRSTGRRGRRAPPRLVYRAQE